MVRGNCFRAIPCSQSRDDRARQTEPSSGSEHTRIANSCSAMFAFEFPPPREGRSCPKVVSPGRGEGGTPRPPFSNKMEFPSAHNSAYSDPPTSFLHGSLLRPCYAEQKRIPPLEGAEFSFEQDARARSNRHLRIERSFAALFRGNRAGKSRDRGKEKRCTYADFCPIYFIHCIR